MQHGRQHQLPGQWCLHHLGRKISDEEDEPDPQESLQGHQLSLSSGGQSHQGPGLSTGQTQDPARGSHPGDVRVNLLRGWSTHHPSLTGSSQMIEVHSKELPPLTFSGGTRI